MAFLMEQAGGRASDGYKEIMDIVPTELHQRCPIYIGSSRLLARVDEFVKTHGE